MERPITDYEQQINNGTITTPTSFSQDVYGLTIPVGNYRKRVKAISPNPAGDWVYNTKGFYVNKGLPTLFISVASVGAINKDTKTVCKLILKNAYGSKYVDSNLYNGTGTIKIRGNSTSGFNKKPWSLETDIKTPVLRYGSEKDWSVLAEYLDPSFMNNALMFRISRAAKLATWTPVVRHIEIYLNNEYQGIYSFIEKIEEGPDRVKITKMTPLNITEPTVTGGYLIEYVVDSQETVEDLATAFTTPETVDFQDEPHSHVFKSPKSTDVVSEQEVWMTNYVNNAEAVLFGVDFTNPTTGWRAYFDVDAAVGFYVLQELGANYDGASKSFYYSKERNGKIKIGPNWDYDNSLSPASVSGLVYNHPWFVRLKEDPYFINQVKIKYTALKPLILAEFANIDKDATVLINSGAIARNFAKWPETMPSGKTYPQLITEKKAWLTSRVAYLDTQFLLP